MHDCLSVALMQGAAGRIVSASSKTPSKVPESSVGSMATIALPRSLGATREDAARLRDALLFEDHIEVAVSARGGQLWTRISAQVYNDWTDVERLAVAISARTPR
jgi:isopenicillin-N epimerase